MAISRDGFIAGPDDETPWSDAELKAFHGFIKSCDAVILGRRTFELMKAENELMTGPRYLVATDNTDLDTGKLEKLAIETAKDLPKVDKLGIIGGGELNGRLATLGVIDELILDIEPVDLHEGIRLFGSYDVPLKLELLKSDLIGETTVQRHYKVIK